MANDKNDKSDRSLPKRGAFPTPKHILDKATPYKPDNIDQSDKPDKSDKAVDPSDPDSDCAQSSHDSP